MLISDSTDEIVAIRVNSLGKKGTNFYPVDPSTKPEGMRKINGILQALRAKCDVYEQYNVTERMDFDALGVHRDHRRKGIGLKIMKAAIALVKNFGISPILIKGEASSNFSQKIYEKCNFDELGEILYNDYKEDGDVVFKMPEQQKSVKYYVRLIR